MPMTPPDDRVRKAMRSSASIPRGLPTSGLVPLTEAAARVALTTDDFALAALDSGWAVLPVHGRPHVSSTDLTVLEALLRPASLRYADPIELAMTTALTEFFAARPVTGDWQEARTQRRPLVCARRGSPQFWAHAGIGHHSVVIQAAWLLAWVGQLDDRDDEAATLMRTRFPLMRSVLLADELAKLDGVDPITSVTPLATSGRNHRVTDWVKVDSALYPPVLVSPWRERVEDPWAAADTAPDAAPGEAVRTDG
jgi:hypothetical protein